MAKEPGSPKKRKEAEPPAAAAAAAMAEQQPGGGKKRRRGKKSKGVGDEANLPRDELERRKRQRKLRDLALRLRAEGQEYKRGKHKKHKPRRRVHLIIVPIFWNKKASEKSAVLEAAEGVQELLRGLGVKCDTDTTTELTPGQKFRAWEEKGIMLRVELGPKEAADGACILARCRTAGEVAEKEVVKVGPQLCERVKAHLSDMGLQLAPPPPAAAGEQQQQQQGEQQEEGEEQEEGEQGEEAQQPASKKSKQAAAGAGATAAVQQAQQGQQQLKRVALPSAEELEGDFAGVELLQQQGPGKKASKKAAAAAEVEAEVEAFKELEEDGGGKKKKGGRKQHKLVAF